MDRLIRHVLPLAALTLSVAVVAAPAPDVRITRGTITVPERRAGGTGRTITLAYLRFHGTAPARASPIVYLAGGPGGSGISDMTASRFAPYRRWLAFADIIALDQRGTGASSPALTCPQGFRVRDGLDTRERILAAYRGIARRCAAWWRGRGVDLSAYTTEANADDVADLARQLGLRRIRLFGASYGSHLGLAVIRRHPALVERAVLGAIEGPDQTIKLPMESDAQLDRITAAMREDASIARIIPDFAALVRRLVAQADRTPLTAGPDRITGFDLRLLISGMMGRRAGIERLPALIGPAARGHFAPIAAAVAEDVRQGDVSAMGAVMDCASWASADRRAAIRRQLRRSLLGTASDFPLPEWRPDWGVPPLPAAFRQPVRSDVRRCSSPAISTVRRRPPTPKRYAEDSVMGGCSSSTGPGTIPACSCRRLRCSTASVASFPATMWRMAASTRPRSPSLLPIRKLTHEDACLSRPDRHSRSGTGYGDHRRDGGEHPDRHVDPAPDGRHP